MMKVVMILFMANFLVEQEEHITYDSVPPCWVEINKNSKPR
jgi:hypothetical protein